MRILFFGTGDIAIPSFEWLAKSADHEVVGLVTQPDKPSGRKLEPHPPKIKTLAAGLGEIPVIQPRRVRDHADELRALDAEMFVVMAYGQIFSREILDIPPEGCVNLHASILPRHRGAAPIQSAILAGDQFSGITVMDMDEKLDTGDVILGEKVRIRPEETGGSLHDRLAEIAPLALEKALTILSLGGAMRTAQNHEDATYAPKLDRHAGEVDWTQPSREIARRVRAFDPWPGTFSKLSDGRTLKLFPPVERTKDEGCPLPGTVVSADAAGLVVATGDGLIRFHSVQAENRRKLTVAEFLNGNPLEVGDTFRKPG